MPSSKPLLLLFAAMAMGAARAAQPADLFDFWLGEWQASWTQADGTPGRGRNVVTKTMDGRVIEERFESEGPQPLRGHSISVLQAATGTWRQAWADNQGGWFAFIAEVDGERRIFATPLAGGKGQRMVFHSIRRDAFTWDWEGTDDGGATWKRLWRIDYRR